MSVKSLQGRRTTYATRIKLMKIKVQNTTVKTNGSWADSWKYGVLVQIECRSADCSTLQDQRQGMPGCEDEVWCQGRLNELQSRERREWKLMRLVHISPVCNLVPYHSAPCRLINIVWTWCALSPAASVVFHVRMGLHALDGHHRKSLELQTLFTYAVCPLVSVSSRSKFPINSDFNEVEINYQYTYWFFCVLYYHIFELNITFIPYYISVPFSDSASGYIHVY